MTLLSASRAIFFCMCFTTVLCSCASTVPSHPQDHGEVSWKAVVDPGQARYTLNPAQVATETEPTTHADVGYPPELVSRNLAPRDVRVKVIVDSSGEVAEVRSVDTSVLADPVSMRLFTNIVSTVGEWRYNPLVISDWVEGSDGSMHRAAAKTVPFTMDYVFHFEVVNGVPRVTEGTTNAQASSGSP